MKRETKKNTSTKAEEPKGFGEGSSSDAPQMMDPDAVEVQRAINKMPRQRVAYALMTLIEEIEELFPETTIEIVDRNGRGVGYAASFATHESPELKELILLLRDPRVEGTIHDDKEDLAFVSLHNNSRTMDNRDPYDLASALAVLREDES